MSTCITGCTRSALVSSPPCRCVLSLVAASALTCQLLRWLPMKCPCLALSFGRSEQNNCLQQQQNGMCGNVRNGDVQHTGARYWTFISQICSF